MKRQYTIMAHPFGYAVACIYASLVEEQSEYWQLYLFDNYLGTVWKDQATLELSYHEFLGAAIEAHYPVISRAYMRSWPVRAGVAEAAGSVGR